VNEFNWLKIILETLRFYRNSGPENNELYAKIGPILKAVLGMNKIDDSPCSLVCIKKIISSLK